MNENNNILFVCGDKSAEIYLGKLLEKISKIDSNIKKFVLGGENVKNLSDEFIEDIVSYDAHGFFSPFTQFFKFLKLLSKVKKILIKHKINLVVLLDYYGFNIRVSKLAKKLGIKVVYYITPQVWASRKNRIKKIKKYVDFVINIYPFERDIFLNNGIKAYYFGHPITDIISDTSYVEKDKNLIGIFPGSRKQVISWNLPVMLKILEHYIETDPVKDKKFVIFGFQKYEKIYQKIIYRYLKKDYHDRLIFCYSNRDELRKKIYVAISVSGTVVLENVFYDVPTIVVYNLPLSMYWLIKQLVYIKYISLPNIMLNKEVIPEFIKNINPKDICLIIEKIYNDELFLGNILTEYKKIKNILFVNKNVSEYVARHIINYLYEKN